MKIDIDFTTGTAICGKFDDKPFYVSFGLVDDQMCIGLKYDNDWWKTTTVKSSPHWIGQLQKLAA